LDEDKNEIQEQPEEKPEEKSNGPESPIQTVKVCEVSCGKLNMLKRIEWPEEMGDVVHDKRIIFEDSYGTDWAVVLRAGSLFDEIEEFTDDDLSDGEGGYSQNGPRRRSDDTSYDNDMDGLTMEDRIAIALRNLDGRAVRYCDEEDSANIEHLAELEAEAIDICEDRVKSHGLPMKLLASDYRYDRSKVTFHFSAENRVDFRQLVRDLASIFKCRIELHQIGIRDEAKLYPGFGPCGQQLCCQRHLTRFKSVSIRMARLQNLPLNPSKISGNCGRLMCCLNYECETYAELSGALPKIGDEKDIDGKRCIVVFVSPLTETITVQLKDEIGKKSTLTRQEYEEGRTAKAKNKES
jgi:cell fate regulator YaaT (PSP1 superfamily)